MMVVMDDVVVQKEERSQGREDNQVETGWLKSEGCCKIGSGGSEELPNDLAIRVHVTKETGREVLGVSGQRKENRRLGGGMRRVSRKYKRKK